METDIVSFECETKHDFSDNSQLQLQRGTNVKDVRRQARNFMTVLWEIALRGYFFNVCPLLHLAKQALLECLSCPDETPLLHTCIQWHSPSLSSLSWVD